MTKKILFTLCIVIISFTAQAQDISGSWKGILKVPGMQLRVVFNVSKDGEVYKSTLDSPDQGAKGIPVTTTSFENNILRITIAKAGIEYEGVLKGNDTITGSFKQAGQIFQLDLIKGEQEKVNRPQEPIRPFTYYEEDITFENRNDSVTLAGTLTLPSKDGIFPVVVLISGSGPQNRDEELMGHKPFLVLSDFLTKNGIAVLRFDDRGVGRSTGKFSEATSIDFASDVEAGVRYLKSRKEIDKKKIGLIGHSEGGLIAPLVATKNKDVAFIILLAGPGIPGDQIILAQQKLIGAASGVDQKVLHTNDSLSKGMYSIVRESTNIQQLKADLKEFLKDKGLPQSNAEATVNQLATPWMQFFIKHNPAKTLEKVKCPVLALNGEKDLQVPAKENLDAIQQALAKGKNKRVTVKAFPGLNHLFQECKTGLPLEYGTIEQTFAPTALTEILAWLNKNL